MNSDIEILINDLLAKMRNLGIDATATTCFNQAGELISFVVTVLGYLD